MQRFLLIQIMIGFGFLGANLLTPWLYKQVPSDFKRTQFLIKQLKEDAFHPDAIVFGNSIGMSGINAQIISDSLDNYGQCYNFSSVGQSIYESALYYPMLPTSTKLVVQLVRAEVLSHELPELGKEELRNFYFYDYDFDQRIDQELSIDMGLAYIDDTSPLSINYESRTVIANFLNNSIRTVLRKDLDLESLNNELLFPNVYKTPISSQKMEKMIKLYNPKEPLKEFSPHPKTIAYFEKVQAYFNSKGIDFVVGIYPINPNLNNFTPDYKASIAHQLEGSSVRFFDFSNELAMEDFIDHWHVSRDGAEKLTRNLVQRLKP